MQTVRTAWYVAVYHRPVTPPHPVPSAPLTVATVQATPTPGDVAGNALAAAELVRRAAGQGARVAVLPELYLCAYHPPTLAADPVGTDVAVDPAGVVADGRLDPLRAAARTAGITVVVGAAARHPDGRRTIAALVVDRAGTVRVGYDKQQLWGDERELFSPGGRGATLLVDDWRLGLGVCYDGCFPEHGRAAALDGAHAYLCPSGYLAGSEHRRDLYYAARALDNTMFVVFANAVGGGDPWRFNGGAAIYDPQGRPLARGADEGTAVLVASLDPAVLADTRAAHSMLADLLPSQGGPRVSLTG
ncbi:Putative nitrilase/cyanide hydratase and apolipoprotein N-acyltransferase [Micromonospora lupini str. Lupac 08]|uniref:Putative nitrilase/cyanide hydratase and apolipoprotein N-acyltransferase n=1 Tax=Micromonospora lupini str. Lupac 08 TaxID=1150864 RepID=I0L897_9ACTN|nr:Putative nitrilase/cyanide hydratase and apolipoprotein N-acyltransferase [Micromonospora lupini str. Lupac 08]